MNIQRNNCEEYFLLYADNELTPKEKKEVEIFLDQNEDLRQEFKLIQLTVNIPDESLHLGNKSFLFKNNDFINEKNYQEIFVLYYDDELTPSERLQTEEFVKDNETLKNEFELFGQVKIIPDQSIYFADRSQLYKKQGKIIPFLFWKSFAAAVLIGFALWIGGSFFNHGSMKPTVAVEVKTNTQPAENRQVIHEEKLANFADEVASSKKTQIKKAPELKVDGEKKELTSTKKMITKNAVNDFSQLKLEDVEKSTPLVAIVDEITQTFVFDEAKKIMPDKLPKSDYKKQSTPAKSGSQTASYPFDETGSNDYVFYNVKMEDFNKSKVGGFLKKVKRIVERNNPVTRLLSNSEETTKESYQ